MSKKDQMWRSLNHVIGVISKCDVILKYKNEFFVGLYYKDGVVDAPCVVCKGNWNFNNYYVDKLAKMNGVPCIEHRPLARELYTMLKEGDILPREYFNSVASVYHDLERFKNKREESEFEKQLYDDALAQIYSLEKKVYREVERKYFKNKKSCNHSFVCDVAKYFADELRILAKDNGLNYRTLYNAEFKTDEYYLETYFEEYDIDFWQLVFVSDIDKKIYVGSKTFYRLFDFSEADIALGFVKALVEAWTGRLLVYVKKYMDEFEINPRLYDIAKNSIKTMVETNYIQNGYEYGFYFDKTVFELYLNKKEIPKENLRTTNLNSELNDKNSKGKRMFETVITYKEFLRAPNIFKDFIKAPKKFSKWNFWCKELKYKQEKFDKKFQTKKLEK